MTTRTPTNPEAPASAAPADYFDTAAAAPPVAEAVDAAVDYLRRTQREGPYLPSLRASVYARIEEVRAEVAGFVAARPEEIAFTRNGTEAICLLARGLRWRAGDEVIVPDTEMLSNVAVWRLLERDAGIRVVPLAAGAEGLIRPDRLAAAITPRTRLVTFAALSNVTGAVQPVRELCAVASAAGALTHVNAAQALGLMPVGLDLWGCDALSACTRKGLRGIEGSGILAVRADLAVELSPTLVGWWNASVDEDGGIALPPTARRLEAGSPNVPAVLALGAALDAARRQGVDAVEERVRALTLRAAAGIRALPGAEVYGPADDADRLGIIPFNLRGVDPRELAADLERRGIVIEAGHFMATPILRAYGIERMARISLHAFNTTDEIDRLLAAITELRGSRA